MPASALVTYSLFGHHGAVITLKGAVTGTFTCAQLIAAVARAVESDRTGIVLDLHRAGAVDADVLQTVLDIHRAGERHAWRVAVVAPGQGPIRSMFKASALDQTLNLFATRTTALVWTLARVQPKEIFTQAAAAGR